MDEQAVGTRLKTAITSRVGAWVCGCAVVLCVVATHPALNLGLNDDWSYAWTARVLAETGRLRYDGWASAMLGWQVYLGALFIKMFGFSFTVLRASVLLVGAATGILAQRTFVRFGIIEFNATIGGLAVVLSPMFLPLVSSFMTDVPGFFCLLLCAYGCLRAMQTDADGVAMRWIAFAAVAGVAGGTVRQIMWLGALVMVPSALWLMRGRRTVLVAGCMCWLASAAAIAACMHWFRHQPYAMVEPLLNRKNTSPMPWIHGPEDLMASLLMLLALALPILVAFVARSPAKQLWKHAAAIAVGLLATKVFYAAARQPVSDAAPFTWDYVTACGIGIPGLVNYRPEVVPFSVRAVLVAAIFVSVSCLAMWLWQTWERRSAAVKLDGLPNAAVWMLLAPSAAAYTLLISMRVFIFDRYLMPLQFLLLIGLLRFYERRVRDRLPLATLVVVGVFALYGMATVHDLFALDRARVAAADELRAAGIPRTAIYAGYEYDGWTQLETTGYINEPTMVVPADAPQPLFPQKLWVPCPTFFCERAPAVIGPYVLSYGPNGPYPLAVGFAAAPYTTWLPPHRQAVYVEKMP